MPVYNGESFIGRAIDSLLAQSFEDWELIVVEDGSTDGTPQILEQHADNNRIRVIWQKNCGEACARNTGLDHMIGEYIAFLDADDLYLPNALKDLASFLDDHPQYGSVFSDGYICDDHERQLMRLTELRPGIFTGKILDSLVITPSIITVPVCTMTRASSIRRNDIRFDTENNLIGTDWDFWVRLSVNEEFGYLDKLTCKYRIHQTNITRTYGSEKRRKDYIYCRMKILNSSWFDSLSVHTRELFFLDLLTIALSGDIEKQQQILKGHQFIKLPSYIRSAILRMVSIDALQTNHSSEIVKQFLLESNQINPSDNKTRFLLGCLKIGHLFTLMLVTLWRWFLQNRKKIVSISNPSTERLQKMLGVR